MKDGEPSPSDPSGGDATRSTAAWRAWLSALASDAEAALAAAMTYDSLDEPARDAWLDALDADVDRVDAPRIALYAPLLAVETNPARRARMERAIGPSDPRVAPPKALLATMPNGDAVSAIVTPLYLEFVELLVCRYHPNEGVFSAVHDPLRHVAQIDAAVGAAVGEAVSLTPTQPRVVIEDLAHAIVAGLRNGRASPPALARYSHLFGPDLELAGGGAR